MASYWLEPVPTFALHRPRLTLDVANQMIGLEVILLFKNTSRTNNRMCNIPVKIDLIHKWILLVYVLKTV